MKAQKRRFDIRAAMTAVYISLVWGAYIYLNVTTVIRTAALLLLFIFLTSYFVMGAVFRRLEKIPAVTRQALSLKKKTVIFALVSCVTFALMMVWYKAYYPGSFLPDSLVQYLQAKTGSYSDWHPVWHTFLFFALPLKLTGSVGSFSFFQILYFSLTMGYMAAAVSEMAGTGIAAVSCLYIWLNPYVSSIILYPVKDVAFALAGLICFVISARAFALKRKLSLWETMLFGVMAASATIFRHNAILFTGFLMIALFFNLDRKTWARLLICAAAAFFIIKVPVYHALHVQKEQSKVIETVGLPLTVIGNVVKENPDCMDDELREFVYSIAPQEEWEAYYQIGDFNSIKFNQYDETADIVEKKGTLGVLKLMLKCFRLSPQASFQALFALTDMVYGFENGTEGDMEPRIEFNTYGIDYPEEQDDTSIAALMLTKDYSTFVSGTAFRYFRTYGVVLLVILVCMLSRLRFGSWNSWKRCFLILPLLAYDYGTLLFLSSSDSRYFFITFLAAPLAVLLPFCGGAAEQRSSRGREA